MRLKSLLAVLLALLFVATGQAPAQAAMQTRATVQTQDGPPPSPSDGKFAVGGSLNAGVTGQATGVYVIATFNKPGVGTVTTYGLLKQGALQEVHTKKGTAWLGKQSGHSIKTLSASKFDQLIAAAGGANRNVETNAAAKANFYQIAGFASSGGGTSGGGTGGGSTGGGSAVPPCPADWATMSEAMRKKAETIPLLRQKYLGCLSLYEAPPADDLLQLAAYDGVQLAADEYRLVFFSISWDNFMRSWGFEWNPQAAMMSFNGFGVTAIWSIESGGAGG